MTSILGLKIEDKELIESLSEIRYQLRYLLFFSLFTNLLMLSPTWYMLEVYDRVVNSHNHKTLLMLTILVLLFYAILEFLEWVRGGIALKIATKIGESLHGVIFLAMSQAHLRSDSEKNLNGINELKNVQDSVSSPAFRALFDLPFSLISLFLIFLINPMLGFVSVFAAFLMGLIALNNFRNVIPKLSEANKFASEAQSFANVVIKRSELVDSMGMRSFINHRWLEKQKKFLDFQAVASDLAGVYSTLSKFTQTLLGSVLLGLGCWLTLEGVLHPSGSMMIIGSVLGGRVLAPIVILLTQWRALAQLKDSVSKLNILLSSWRNHKNKMQLPKPKGEIFVDGVSFQSDFSDKLILQAVTFKLSSGKSLAIVGPTASGKSTLAKLICGIKKPSSGLVRLDGVDIFSWDKNEIGPNIGYLPQAIDLFEGSISENIARFGDADENEVKKVAKIVGLDELITSLPLSYETHIGDEGSYLSGGQRQRIALARAIYGSPRMVILDEPNSSLDEEGDLALIEVLRYLKRIESTVIVITHRTQIISELDNMLVLISGRVAAYGPKDEVLKSLSKSNN